MCICDHIALKNNNNNNNEKEWWRRDEMSELKSMLETTETAAGAATSTDCVFTGAMRSSTAIIRVQSVGGERSDASGIMVGDESFPSVAQTSKGLDLSSNTWASASLTGDSAPPANVVPFLKLPKDELGKEYFGVPEAATQRARFHGVIRRRIQSFSARQGRCRDLSAFSVLDLATMDLEQLKKSFFAHAKLFSRSDLLEMYKVAGNVAREMRHAERQAERQQRRKQIHRTTPRRTTDSARLSETVMSDLEDGIGGDSVASVAEESTTNGLLTESVLFSKDYSSKKTRLLCIWLYDRLMEQQLCNFRNSSSSRQRDTLEGHTNLVARTFLGSGTKMMMLKLRGPPTPQKLFGFDVFDELSDRLRERDPSSSMLAANMSMDNLPLPLPVFVYVFSRAVFRACHLDRFPKEAFNFVSSSLYSNTPFSSAANNISQPGTSIADAGRNASRTFSFGSGYNNDGMVQEVSVLLEECRHVVMRFFELFDREQRGCITWSSFTDLLMERVEVQHRLMVVKENSEADVQSDARVFDEYVLEPFPSVIRQLGYVGAVTEVRHSHSAIIVEGQHDFAVWDSSYYSLIWRKLLVRSADVLFSHRPGAPDEWDAERWDAAADSARNLQQERRFNRRILRQEEGSKNKDESQSKMMKKSRRTEKKGNAVEDNNLPGETGDDRIDRRAKPSIESALQVYNVSPELPKTYVTLHNDLLLRFFNIEQHIWVIPESITVSCAETITSMEWCPSPPEGDTTMNWYMFLGTRSGGVLKVDLREILRKLPLAKNVGGDVITTGMAATSTVCEKLGPYILQRNNFHEEFVTSLSLTPAGVLLSASLDGTVVLSRASNMTSLRSFRLTDDSGVRYACITPIRNIILTLSATNRLSIWGNSNQSSYLDLYDPISPHYFPIISVKVDESLGQLITVDSSGYAKVWSLRTNLTKMSFYAVSGAVFSAFRHMYTAENAVKQNGYRLFDVDEKEKKHFRPQGDANAQHGTPAILQTTLATVEAAMHAKSFYPARYVAYDSFSKRLFVSGAKNNVVCVFVSGLGALKAHSSPICHVSICERNRWVVSASIADCRLWSYEKGALCLGLKANSLEFAMVRMAPVFDDSGTKFSTSAELEAVSGETDCHTLDACKQPLPTLSEVMNAVNARTVAQRMERSVKWISKRMTSADEMRRTAMLSRRGRYGSGCILSNTIGNTTIGTATTASTVNGGTLGAGTSSGGLGGGMDFSGGCTTDDDLVKSQGTLYRILCVHVDIQENFIFYALSNGDIRVHRTHSGRLSKTLVTMPPSTDLILAAVIQYRHIFTFNRRPSERRYSSLTEGMDIANGFTGAQIRVHDIAFILHRLLHHEKKIKLQEEEGSSIHKEAIGMMTTSDVKELGVMYADGVIRFFPLIGSSVHAHRIIIPEFLVARATKYMQLERSLQRKMATLSHEFTQASEMEETHKRQLKFIVEADAVSFVAVSETLEFICLVQVNGRISIMDMRTQTGAVVQVFTVSGEVSAVSFLGAYPCLVVADTQGTVSFFLVKGAAMLNLLEDFYKSLVLHRRQQRRRHSLLFVDMNTKNESDKYSRGSTLRMWYFRIPGTPTALHFDPIYGALYIGTRQGYFSSYLVRNLIVAFDLHPIINVSRAGKPLDPPMTSTRQVHDSNEPRLLNVLLVFFGITPDRVMRYLETERPSSATFGRDFKPTPNNTGVSVSWRGADSPLSSPAPRAKQNVSPPAENVRNERGTAVTRLWKSSLSWIFEACKPLFFPTSSTASARDFPEAANLPFDILTVTFSELLVGAAILRHALLTMSMMSGFTSMRRPSITNAAESFTSSGSSTCHQYAAVSLTVSDIRHIRQCIVEELRYRNWSAGTGNERQDSPASEGSPGRFREVEEEFDFETVRDNSYVIPGTITANWVEFLFRRHVVNSVNESPLTLLSPSATLERARCERYERCRLLQLQHDLEREAQKEFIGTSWVNTTPSGEPTAITVDWNAFMEGTGTHLLEEAFRRRRGEGVGEEDFLNPLDDFGGVRCIKTRRNGLLFVGSANGSVAVWTTYGGARIQELCPSMLLKESLRCLGEKLKMRLAQEVGRVIRRRQREAYATSSHNAKGHDTMLRNLNVKYKAAMMKKETVRGVILGNSITEFGESSNETMSSLSNNAKQSKTARIFPKKASFPQLTTEIEKTRSRLVKQKEVLLALLNTTPSEASERGILIEDLYFLPMHTTMLSELEDFDLVAYDLAVDLAVRRLEQEVCCETSADDAGNVSIADSRRGSVLDVLPNGLGDEANAHTVQLSFAQWGGSFVGELGGEPMQEDVHSFLITAHEKLQSAFCTEELSCMRWKAAASYSNAPKLGTRRRRMNAGGSLTCVEWQRSIFNQYTAELSHSSSSSWNLPHERNLPSYARPGRCLGPGVITVGVCMRQERRLKGCFGLELERMAKESRWHTADEAIETISGQSQGLLSVESLAGLSRSLAQRSSRNTRVSCLVEAFPTGKREKRWEAQQPKTTRGLLEPLLILVNNRENDSSRESTSNDHSPRQLSELRSPGDFFLVLNGVDKKRRPDEGSGGTKERCFFFLTEGNEGSSPADGSSMTPPTVLSPACSGFCQPFRLPARKTSTSIFSARTEDDDSSDATPGVLMQWQLHSKDHSHRAKLSRTGRVTATHSRCQSITKTGKTSSVASRDGADSHAGGTPQGASPSRSPCVIRPELQDPVFTTISFQEGSNPTKSGLGSHNERGQTPDSLLLPLLNSSGRPDSQATQRTETSPSQRRQNNEVTNVRRSRRG
ncbi:hypothetical protein MOQ_008246 [Trypanosoma cruzi marinkellei]|uniref:Uncharacterized protein n=1 Tax=Trypanosoma cruzi marinkellei TaxID=85056 RepID=K2LZA4_TRYCR|nr:hypothetical protein MOQ_008246 [Trypanosoma cruzi marinkellei]